MIDATASAEPTVAANLMWAAFFDGSKFEVIDNAKAHEVMPYIHWKTVGMGSFISLPSMAQTILERMQKSSMAS